MQGCQVWSGCGWHHSFASILFVLDEQTGHMGLSLTKRTQEINRRFLQISKFPSARVTQGLPDTERSHCKLEKLRNVLLPPIPVNTSWKEIQWRGLQDCTTLYFISMDQAPANQHLRVCLASQTQPAPYPHVLRSVWSSGPFGMYPDSSQPSYNFRREKQNCKSMFGKICLSGEWIEKLNLPSLMKRRWRHDVTAIC